MKYKVILSNEEDTNKFLRKQREFNYNLNYIELSNSRNKQIYKQICDLLRYFNATLTDTNNNITNNEVKQIIDDIFKYHNKSIYDKFLNDDLNIEDIPMYMYIQTGKILKGKMYTSNYHYKYVLPILMEYIISREIDNITSSKLEDNASKKRLLYNKSNLAEYLNATNLIEVLNVDDNEKLKNNYEYFGHLQYAYLISDIYATRLLDLYDKDSTVILKEFNKILIGLTNLDDLLKYYSVSLQNIDTHEQYCKKIKYYNK